MSHVLIDGSEYLTSVYKLKPGDRVTYRKQSGTAKDVVDKGEGQWLFAYDRWVLVKLTEEVVPHKDLLLDFEFAHIGDELHTDSTTHRAFNAMIRTYYGYEEVTVGIAHDNVLRLSPKVVKVSNSILNKICSIADLLLGCDSVCGMLPAWSNQTTAVFIEQRGDICRWAGDLRDYNKCAVAIQNKYNRTVSSWLVMPPRPFDTLEDF